MLKFFHVVSEPIEVQDKALQEKVFGYYDPHITANPAKYRLLQQVKTIAATVDMPDSFYQELREAVEKDDINNAIAE